MNTTRINLMIPNNVKTLIDEKAKNKGMSLQDIVRNYIQSGLAIDILLEDGGRLFVEMKDGKQAIVVIVY